MSSKGGESRAVKQPLKPSFVYDGSRCYISVSCNGYRGQLYLDKFDVSKHLLGKCILFCGTYYTPPEFESYCGKKCKQKWRQSIMHLGKLLCDYKLTSSPKQGHCSTRQYDLSSSCTQDTVVAVSHGNVLPGNFTCNTNSTTSSSVLISSTLSFIKAYKLKGDNGSLQRRVCDLFSPEKDNRAKTLLWNHCKQDLEAAGLHYHARRASDKCNQLTANLDDIVQAFNCLNSADLVPVIYCEA